MLVQRKLGHQESSSGENYVQGRRGIELRCPHLIEDALMNKLLAAGDTANVDRLERALALFGNELFLDDFRSHCDCLFRKLRSTRKIASGGRT